MKSKKGFSLLEVTVSILIMGVTIAALLNILDWSNKKYFAINSAWKTRACFTDARVWLRDQILSKKDNSLSLKNMNESIKRPEGFYFSELVVRKHDDETFFVKLGVFEDRNHNKKPDSDETTKRLFCFRRRA